MVINTGNEVSTTTALSKRIVRAAIERAHLWFVLLAFTFKHPSCCEMCLRCFKMLCLKTMFVISLSCCVLASTCVRSFSFCVIVIQLRSARDESVRLQALLESARSEIARHQASLKVSHFISVSLIISVPLVQSIVCLCITSGIATYISLRLSTLL